MSEPRRYIVASICVDETGRWSMDVPHFNPHDCGQIGTMWVGDLEATVRALGAVLTKNQEAILKQTQYPCRS